MTNIPNFLEEEDYDQATETAAEAEPVFGVPGFGKGKNNPRKGSPRARITERDIPVVYFLGHFPGADVEACSVLNTAKRMKFGSQQVGGGLTSVVTTQNRLEKLRKLGVVERYRHPVTGTFSYGLTGAGFAAARDYGLNMDSGRTLHGISISRLAHYRTIALVAAKFASPAGYFKETLGINPVRLEHLISENRMRAAYEPAKEELAARKKDGKTHDFGKWRADKLGAAKDEVTAGQLHMAELIDAYPVLLTLGQPQGEEVIAKPVHQPDLAIYRDENRADNQYSLNIMVEVELSKKDRPEYTRILATIAAELKDPLIYSRCIYFAIGPQVEVILRQLDAANNFKLFESGKLEVVAITDRNGVPVAQNKRITIGGN